MGLLLDQYLASQPRVLFCPASDQPVDADAELARVGSQQAQGSYYYRHAGNTLLFDNPATVSSPRNIKLQALGENRHRLPIRALAMDTIFLCPPDLEPFNVKPRTHHRQKSADILFTDGHTASRPNTDARFTVDIRNYAEIRDAFSKILAALEQADAVP